MGNKLPNDEILRRGKALCPLDGRYKDVGQELAPYFSEYGLMQNRVLVEVRWLIFMNQYVDGVDFLDERADDDFENKVMSIYEDYSDDGYLRIKEIEAVTNHDVKAVELYVAEQLEKIGYGELKSYVHIGCTSEDINNLAYAMMLDEGKSIWKEKLEDLINTLKELATQWENIPMLAHTHGQPATPTTVGKEIVVFAYRLEVAKYYFENLPVFGKFNGATGNYAAIDIAFSENNWPALAERFVEGLGLEFNPVTTQIESHDYMCRIFDAIRNVNNIILDMDVDMWLYIAMEYFKQIPVKTEVGSSTMPHKVNPIRFENSESNIGLSNTILMELSNKLPKSRMQRDLSDSSTQRNIGMAIGYSLQAIEQAIGGLKKVEVHREKIASELENNWEVLAEPIQTMLRKYGMSDAYDRLKEMTRGKRITKDAIHEFILSCEFLSEDDKNSLLNLTPAKYIGWAEKIAYEASYPY